MEKLQCPQHIKSASTAVQYCGTVSHCYYYCCHVHALGLCKFPHVYLPPWFRSKISDKRHPRPTQKVPAASSLPHDWAKCSREPKNTKVLRIMAASTPLPPPLRPCSQRFRHRLARRQKDPPLRTSRHQLVLRILQHSGCEYCCTILFHFSHHMYV